MVQSPTALAEAPFGHPNAETLAALQELETDGLISYSHWGMLRGPEMVSFGEMVEEVAELYRYLNSSAEMRRADG